MILLTGHPEAIPFAINVLTFICVVPVAMIVLFIINISPFYQKRVAGKPVAFKIAFAVGELVAVIICWKIMSLLGFYLFANYS